MQPGQLIEEVEDALRMVRWMPEREQRWVAERMRRQVGFWEEGETMTREEVKVLRDLESKAADERFAKVMEKFEELRRRLGGGDE